MSTGKGKGKARAFDPEDQAMQTGTSHAPPSASSSKNTLSSSDTQASASASAASSSPDVPGSTTSPSPQQELLLSARQLFNNATQYLHDDNFEQLYSCLFAANDTESMLACRMFLSAHAKVYALKKRDIVRPDQLSANPTSLSDAGPTRNFTALLCLEAQLQHFIPQFHLLFPNTEHIKSMFSCHCMMLSSLIFVLVSQASGNAPSTRSTTVTLPDLLPSEIHTTVALLRGQFKAVSSLLYYHYDTVHSNTSASLVRSACAKFIKFWGPFRAKYVVQFQKADSKLSNGSSTGQAPAQGSVLDRRMDAIQDLAVHLCLAINAGVDVARFGGSKYRGDAARAKADVREYILSDVDFYGKRDSLVCGIGCLECGRTTSVLEEADAFKLCSACGIASFCNVACFHAHWPMHKKWCTGRHHTGDKGKGKSL